MPILPVQNLPRPDYRIGSRIFALRARDSRVHVSRRMDYVAKTDFYKNLAHITAPPWKTALPGIIDYCLNTPALPVRPGPSAGFSYGPDLRHPPGYSQLPGQPHCRKLRIHIPRLRNAL
jgi:hypothetical protein